MKQPVRFTIVILLLALAWLVWQKPASAPDRSGVRAKLPEQAERTDQPSSLWRVVTRSVVSEASANTLEFRLQQMGLQPIRLKTTEEVTLHVFDDAALFQNQQQALDAVRIWNQLGIDSSPIRSDNGQWLVGLGRFSQSEHAAAVELQLQESGREFRYQQRLVPTPAWRFTFSPSAKKPAEALWKQLQNTGLMAPAMLQETQFQTLYGKSLPATPNRGLENSSLK